MKLQEQILEILKSELQYKDSKNGYTQWIMGLSIKKQPKSIFSMGQDSIYTARTLIKTSEGPYVDGMDITFTKNHDKVEIDPEYYENGPSVEGAKVEDALRWLEKLGEEVYIQIENPYLLQEYMKNLENILKEYHFHNLMDYTLSSEAGYNLIDLYKDLIQETILEEIEIFASERSDGKYKVEVKIGENSYTFNSRAWYIKEDIIYEIRRNVLLPLIEDKEKEDNKNYIREETISKDSISQSPKDIKADEDYGF